MTERYRGLGPSDARFSTFVNNDGNAPHDDDCQVCLPFSRQRPAESRWAWLGRITATISTDGAVGQVCEGVWPDLDEPQPLESDASTLPTGPAPLIGGTAVGLPGFSDVPIADDGKVKSWTA